MATELELNLRAIEKEKTEKIIPENIKKGVTIFDVEGIVENGMMQQAEYDAAINDISSLLGYSEVFRLFEKGTIADGYQLEHKYLGGSTDFVATVDNEIYWKGVATPGSGCECAYIFTPEIDFTNAQKIIIHGSTTGTDGGYGIGTLAIAVFNTTSPDMESSAFSKIGAINELIDENGDIICTKDTMNGITKGYFGFRLTATPNGTNELHINQITIIYGGE